MLQNNILLNDWPSKVAKTMLTLTNYFQGYEKYVTQKTGTEKGWYHLLALKIRKIFKLLASMQDQNYVPVLDLSIL